MQRTDMGSALNDLILGLRRHSLWWALSLNEIRQRYRRSVLGPFWLSLSMLIMVVALGVIYSQLFSMEIRDLYSLLGHRSDPVEFPGVSY